MKRIYFYTILLGLLTFISCEEDKTPVMELQRASEFQAFTQSEFVFSKENATAEFPIIKWTESDYGAATVVNYDVTLTNIDNNKSVLLGTTGANELKMTNAQMNTFIGKVGVYPGQTSNITISLVAKAYDYASDASVNTISFKATSYDPKAVNWKFAYVAVGYPDWDYTTAYLLGDPDGDGTYNGFVNFDSDGVSYAIIDGSDVTKVLAQGNTIEAKGFYEIKVDETGQLTQSPNPIVWGVIGDATAGGWGTDTEMDYNEDTRLWTTITSFGAKEFKFRGNNDWGINFGAVEGEENELSGKLIAGGPNFKVLKASAYVITLNLTNAGEFSYLLEETTVELSSTTVYLPGSYQAGGGWNAAQEDCYQITSPARDFIYTGEHYFPANTSFKFFDNNVWTGLDGSIAWNESKTEGKFLVNSGGGENVTIEPAGYYKIMLNTKKLTSTLKMAAWEIIGNATSGGWDTGTLMTYDPEKKLWTVDVTLTATAGDGENGLKFRWDGAWEKQFGGSFDALVSGGGNIATPAGEYTITLDPVAGVATIAEK